VATSEKNVPGVGVGRDPVPTPMQWEPGPNAGFRNAEPASVPASWLGATAGPSVHGVAIGEDLIHLLRGVPAAEVRAAIDTAFQPGALRSEDAPTAGTPSVEQVLAVETATGEARYLQIACYPHTTEAPEPDAPTHRGRDTVLLVVLDVTQSERERRAREEEREREAARHAEDVERLTAQVQRLTTVNDDLLAANQELATANMELRSGLEEALVRAEETQASTEEVEILNEELQASNEELETVNEELQATIEELNATNADRRARRVERDP
jgi:two-component system, chemotaxis family, CheB/CheR fusion protein